MLGLLSQPKPQRADETIITLCDRLSHSLLLEDRKAAVLSLRGLAHDSRELVASSGLRGLLETLVKDSHDNDAARTALETLLILFSPETRRRRVRKYVSPLIMGDRETDDFAANDISLWLADELLHNEEALSTVLSLAATKNDPFTSVYALQLVSAMAANRPAETKQAMLASGGVSTIVAALGSVQDMVRDESLLLLGALTADHLDLQKLVVFEGGFDRVFGVLADAGGVVFGGRLVEDCLSLLANLLQYNTSNQSLFTQSGYVKQWVALLEQIREAEEENVSLGEQHITNIVAALQIGQLLTVKDAERTVEHQNILNADGALRTALEIAFGSAAVSPVRVAALVTVASLVDGNTRQQNDLLAIDVPYYDMTLRKVGMVDPAVVPVAQGLLNWALTLNSTHLFDLRAASLLCLVAALRGNAPAKANFLQDQIDSYGKPVSPSSPTTNVNIIEVLAEYSDENRLNPFRVWFASAIVMHIFVDSPESKELLQGVTVGDESLGMDVHSFIQAIAGEMQSALNTADPTAALGYLQLLTVWFYDDPEAVSDFTAESSAVQSLLAHHDANSLVQSLAAITLGTAYAFCSSQSSMPRVDFHQLLTKSLGRDHYLLLMRKFRSSPAFQNYDEADIFGAPRGPNGTPAVHFDSTFVDLMRDSLGKISRAIDADPSIEPSARISFEMVEDLNVRLHEKTQSLAKTEKELSAAAEELEHLKASLSEIAQKLELAETARDDASSSFEEANTEISVLRKTVEEAQTDLEAKKTAIDSLQTELTALTSKHSKAASENDILRAAKEKAEDGINKMTRELFQLQKAKESFEKEAKKLQGENSKLAPKLESSQKTTKELQGKLASAHKQSEEDSRSIKQLREVNEKLVAKLKETAEHLKGLEEHEESLSSELKTTMVNLEEVKNELRSVQNRESLARKEIGLAKEKIASLQSSEKRANTLASEVANLESEKEALREKAEAGDRSGSEALEKAEKMITELKERNSKLQSESDEKVKELNQKVQKLEGDNDALRKSQTKSKETAASDKIVTDLRSELDEKSQALDELIVLLDDLTDKKSKYKSRLRSLSEEVSESEEEDGDDDDDDENSDTKKDSSEANVALSSNEAENSQEVGKEKDTTAEDGGQKSEEAIKTEDAKSNGNERVKKNSKGKNGKAR